MAKKISRPVIYSLLAAVVAGAVVFLTEPDAPVKHTKPRRTNVTVQVADGVTEADLNAHFARYTGGKRDSFAPAVTPVKPAAAVKPTPKPIKVASDKGTWELTGVNTIDGAASAVVENRASGDVAFLKTGDTWHGLHVVQIAPESLVLENEIGQKTRLAFKTEEPDTPSALAASANVPGAPPLPFGQQGAQPQLVPMPIQPLPGLTPGTAPGFAQGATPAFTPGDTSGADNGFGDQGGGRRGRRGRRQN
ncbi:MAG: hypothetical protein ABIY70_25700 [Capsulimonas sp.]|uniref:hypothetical protein n=1 Tax=Capsulimonas sp. TaxID=2494211 RepID=UPI003263C639